MKATNRSALILLAVVIGAVALAVVVVTHSGETDATSLGVYGSQGSQTDYLAADEATAGDASAETGESLLDPAKMEPILDKFQSKDPFTQLYGLGGGGGGGGGGSPAPSAQPSVTPDIVGADIVINSKLYPGAKRDQKLPNASTGPFQIVDITASGVRFKLLGGYVIGTDTSEFTVNLNEPTEVSLTGPDGTKTYRINVTRLVYGATGGSGGTGGTGGTGGGSTVTQGQHSIKVVSIDTQNGVPSCTLVVDGVTYANKKVGDTFATGWGQIKILGINVSAQTVTILHGDARVTIQVGQSVAK